MKRFAGIPEQFYVFFAFLAFFLCTLASNFSGPHDSIGYLNGMVKGNALFHQHHLIYHYITHYWLVGIRTIFPDVPDYYLVEAFTAFWGSGSLAIAYCFLRKRFGLPLTLSALGTLVIAFTYGMWFYSVNIEVYAPPMFFLLAALYRLSDPDFGQKDVWKVALLQCIAILFHQVHILFTVTVLLIFWQRRKKLNIPKAVLQYALIGIVLVGGMYFLVGWVVEEKNTVARFVNWIEGYAADKSYWHPVSWHTPVYVITGLAHAFIGGHFVFQLPGINTEMSHAVQGHSLSDEFYLVRNMGEPMAIFLSILTLALAFFMFWLAIRFVRKYGSIRKQYSFQMRPLLVTGLVYSFFFFFWEPEILEFWIFQTVVFWILLFGTLAHDQSHFPFRMKPAVAIGSIAALLFVINFFGSVRYLLHLENDLYYTKVEPIKDVATPKDAVLVQDFWILKDFVEYYTPVKVWEVPKVDTQRVRVDSEIRQFLQSGGKLYIYPEGRPGYGNKTYIDSLLQAYPSRHQEFHTDHPRIVVLQ